MPFDEDTKLFPSPLPRLCAVKPLGQRPIVDRIDGVEGLRGASSLVALQVADEVPASPQIRQRAQLPFPFLNAVFAKVAETGVVGFANRARRMRFRNSDQKNLFGFSGGTARGHFDFLANVVKVFTDC